MEQGKFRVATESKRLQQHPMLSAEKKILRGAILERISACITNFDWMLSRKQNFSSLQGGDCQDDC